MRSSTSFKLSRSCAILLVGEPKTGKTCLEFAFPKPYILDLDMNLASAMRRAPGKTFFYDQPAIGDNEQPIPVENRWNALVKCTKDAAVNPEIETIIVDGLGVLTELLCAHIINEGRKAGTNKTGKMEIQSYGDLARMLRDYIMFLRTTGKIIVVTSHQTADKDEVTGALRYVLAIPGQSKDTLGGLFTDVWATTAKPSGQTTKYEVRTKPTGYHVALGTSFLIEPVIDVTDKTPDQIWSILGPKLERPATPSVPVPTK